MEETNKKPSRRSRRPQTRKDDGTFSELASTDIAPGLEKTVDYTVKPRIDGTTNPTVGPYGKREGLRPTFGNVRTIKH